MRLLITGYRRFQENSLFKNSIYLIMATAVMSGFGFIFWIFGAKLFTTDQVGIASSLVSVGGIVSSLSLLGFNNSLIKYIPIVDAPGRVFRNAITLTGVLSLLVASVSLVIIHFFNPSLRFVTGSALYSILFILFCFLTTINFIIENTFIALRTSIRVFYKNTIYSVTKLVMPVFLVSLAAFGIFTAIGIGLAAACLYSVYYLWKRGFYFKPSIDRSVIRMMMHFSLGNYVVSVFNGLPALALPILITATLGPTASGYYYIDFLIISLLFVIPSAASNSFFAEGAQRDASLRTIIVAVVKITYALLIPAMLIIIFFGPFILTILGKNYGTEGSSLLRILTVSGIFVGFNNLCGSLLNLHHKIKELMIVNIVGVALVLSSVALCLKFGLNGIGYGWFIGQGLISLTYLIYVVGPLRNIFSKRDTSMGVTAL